MFLKFLLIFTAVPFVEFMILIEVGKRIGVLPTLAIVVATGVAGAALARWQGFSLINRIQKELQEGRMPAESLLDGVLILVGALLLLTPGFLTDAAGFSLLIPPLRSGYRQALRNFLRKRFQIRQEYYSIYEDDPHFP